MQLSVEQITIFLKEKQIKYQYTGSSDLLINNFCALSEPKAYCITWIKKAEGFDFSAIDVHLNMLFITNFFDKEILSLSPYNIIECDNPKEVFFEILNQFFVIAKESKIEANSVIETKHIGKNVSIGHHCYICKDVTIGNNVVVKNNVVIECPAAIGDNTIIWSGVIIGTDGYGYFQKEDGINYKVPHFGGVRTGRNVEIGANTCIDRGTLGDTIIGNNVKIDNLCHIAHNVRIEDNALVIALSMLAGSSVVGEHAYIAPGVLLLNQTTVGKGAFVGLGSVVTKDIPENAYAVGFPVRVLGENNNSSLIN